MRDHPAFGRPIRCNAMKQLAAGPIEDQRFAVQIDRHNQTSGGDDNPGNHWSDGFVLPANRASVGIDRGKPNLPSVRHERRNY